MSLNRVQGKNQIVEMKISGVWYPIFCCKSMSFFMEQDMIEITSINSAVAREFQAGMTTSGGSVSGVTIIDNTQNQISILYLMPEAQRRTVQDMRIRMTADNATAKQISFQALIRRLETTRTFGSYSQSAVEIVVTGGVSIGVVEPPGGVITENVWSDRWVPGAGNSYIDGSSAGVSPSSVAFGGVFNLGATDTILEVSVDGDHFDLITSGAPGNMECKFDSGLGQIRFASTLIFLGTERVWVEFKRTV